ncbi:ethanolamine ammonia-lyase reactivating factor EutA [Desulfosediminicola sp.]|uniref:ethanolamine ammonia-lyase reactivating factor EutA n=1 Tax=Desulfosediminicola sp. TaxID=2886825 RepID=UPI003AF27AE3
MSSREKEFHKNGVVTMVGLDFGSTTSSAMVAHARVGRNSVTGRMAFGHPDIIYRSEPVFTPFENDRIDEIALRGYLDRWLQASGIRIEELFSGGAIITGLATEKANAGRIAELVKERVGEAIIATASDPCLESWLAFMGSCSTLSRCHSERAIINLDIGGGTTNPALGVNGNVLAAGCYFIGARHFQFEPGTYRLTSISTYGCVLLDHLGISRKVGDDLKIPERDAILEFYRMMLEAIVRGPDKLLESHAARLHTQIPLPTEELSRQPVITFSGGVGELIYRHALGQPLPDTTHFGDLGIDLARSIMSSPILSAGVSKLVPENMGRATVYGLAIHSTEVSGATLFLPRKEILPLQDVPIVGRMSMDAGDEKVRQLIRMIAKSERGGAIQVTAAAEDDQSEGVIKGPSVEKMERVKALGQSLYSGVVAEGITPDTPLIVLVPNNCGKSLGNYATGWRRLSANIVVIDEIPDRNAHFVNIGRNRNNIVPVSFYGVQ